MALTRKLLKGMSLTEEQMDTIIEAHTDTVDGLKKRITDLEEQVKDVPSLQKKLEQAEKELADAENGGWKDKHDKVRKEFDDYKAEQARKDTRAAKEKAVRAYLEGKNIKDGNLNIAMRGLSSEIDAVELDGDSIKDTAVLDTLVSGDYASLVTKPAAGIRIDMGGKLTDTGGPMSKNDIMNIKDRAERRAAIAANMNTFTKGE